MTEASKTFEIPAALEGKTYVSSSSYEELYARSVKDPERFWAEQAEAYLSWDKKWDRVLEWDYHKAEIKWFLGGKINVCNNCVDRHVETRGDQAAIIWEGNEPGDTRTVSYTELHDQVCRMANVLRDCGVSKGDRVAVYLPMVPELAVTMLACARIGAVHSVIFAGFSAESIKDRVLDSSCTVLVTANEGLRGPKSIPLKAIVDEALSGVECVQRVLVLNRTETSVPMQEGRDIDLYEALKTASNECAYEPLDAEDPLFILYTSGSTGKPKGVLHTQAGYLLYTSYTHKNVFDYRDGDVYFCAADIGWITGHSYIVYGPLANGATTVMFESTPLYPDAGRYWDTVSRHKASIFYTAPTAIRAIAKEGDAFVNKYDLSCLRILGTVGEPINEDAWLWYYNIVGKGNCAIVDTWWQTETGGILISPLPGATATKPGSATKPLPGVQPVLVDDDGAVIEGNDVKGKLCIKFPWPGQMRTVYGDHERFFDTYFKQYPGMYFTNDACRRDEDGYYWIIGRVDDVLNVSGHRLGTAEVESAIVHSGVVAEAAVVGMPHEVKGTGIYAFCIANEHCPEGEEAVGRIRDAVRSAIGPIASPDVIQIVPGLPKTRSGKIMRRILRKIASGDYENFGDITTLADSSVVAQIVEGAQGQARKVANG